MKKVTLCSQVMMGTADMQFDRKKFKYDNNKIIHPPINSQPDDNESEMMIIDMPLEDPASYLKEYLDFDGGLLSDEEILEYLQGLIQ